jgi:hypothetical protein
MVVFPAATAAAQGGDTGEAGVASTAGALLYASAKYRALVNRRPRYMRALLGLGVDVLYTDIDTVWLGSPLDGFTGEFAL